MSWAIGEEHRGKKKEAVMKTDDLKKSDSVDDYNEKSWRGFSLGDDDE